MDPILQTRLWFSIVLVFVGLFLPLMIFVLSNIFKSYVLKWHHVIGYIIWATLWIVYGKDLIPEEYDVKTIKVYQCDWVERTVPIDYVEAK